MEVNASFWKTYQNYAEDDSISQKEYDSLKSIYTKEYNVSSEEFDLTYGDFLKVDGNDSIDINQGVSQFLKHALSDGQITSKEFFEIKDYYMDEIGIDEDVFNHAVFLFLQEYEALKRQGRHELPELDLKDLLTSSIEKAMKEMFEKFLFDTRRERDFNKSVFDSNQDNIKDNNRFLAEK